MMFFRMLIKNVLGNILHRCCLGRWCWSIHYIFHTKNCITLLPKCDDAVKVALTLSCTCWIRTWVWKVKSYLHFKKTRTFWTSSRCPSIFWWRHWSLAIALYKYNPLLSFLLQTLWQQSVPVSESRVGSALKNKQTNKHKTGGGQRWRRRRRNRIWEEGGGGDADRGGSISVTGAPHRTWHTASFHKTTGQQRVQTDTGHHALR